MEHILIVEDDGIQAKMLSHLLVKAGYQVNIGRDGVEGLQLARSVHPHLIISDVSMPVMDGFELCQRIREDENLHGIPVILLTTMTDVQDVVRGLNVGADNYAPKPYDIEPLLECVRSTLGRPSQVAAEAKLQFRVSLGGAVFDVRAGPQQILNLLLSTYRYAILKNQVLLTAQDQLTTLNNNLQAEVERKSAALIEGERRLGEERQALLNRETAQLREIHNTLLESVAAIAATLEMRDPYTAGHQRRVADLAVLIGKQLKLSAHDLEGLHIAGVVHDIGKVRIPTQILTKPGRYDEVEYEFMKTHAQTGYEILKNIRFPWPIADIVVQHHERLDGSGYPRGLTGHQILLGARILAVADVIDSMVIFRPFQEFMGLDAALGKIQAGSGTKYDAAAVDAFLSIYRQGLWSPATI